MVWQAPRTRPYLLVTPEMLANTRLALEMGQPSTHAAFARCEQLAQQALAMELPVFNNTWFIGLQRADWERTWNDEWVYTWKIPGVLADPALGAALHYALTGAQASLRGAKRILQHALGFSFGASHFDVGLYYSFWCLPLLFAYDCIYNALTPEERQPIEEWFAAFGAAVRANDELWVKEILGGKLNNHYAWHKWALGVYGLHSGQAELVEYALEGPVGYRAMVTQGLRDDGLWLECSTNYNFSIHRPLTMLCWSLRNAVWPEDIFAKSFASQRSLLDMYLAPLYWLFPDGSVPNVGDCYGERVYLPQAEYAYAWAAYRDPRLAWALSRAHQESEDFSERLIITTRAQDPEPPDIKTRNWPEHGYALLTSREGRPYFTERSAACFITYGYSGIHSHQDKLSFELHAAGERWLIDGEAETTSGNAFLAPIERELGRSTLAHNTVMVDQRSQRSLNANLPAVFAAAERRILVTDAGVLYAGVEQARELRLNDRSLEDCFMLRSDMVHTYDYLLHFAAGAALELPIQPEACPLWEAIPYNWLRRVRRAELGADNLTVVARLNGKTLRLRLGFPVGSTLFAADFPRRDDYAEPQVPLLVVRCTAKAAVFKASISWDG
ncbi:MAG: heparinase II/III family protein [Chloroflexi bacterium]|nr:heparinase II/III family protein [Chloroflexota bacterium]